MDNFEDIAEAEVGHRCKDELIISKSPASVSLMDTKELGTRFKRAREAKGLTQQDVANELDVSLRSVQYFEKGEKSWSLEKVIIAFKLVDYRLFLIKDIEELN